MGLLAAIWLMPYGGPWPTTGEIDMMEHLNNDTRVYQTLHYGTNDSGSRGVQKDFGSVGALNEQWHTYGLLWQEGQIQFLVDGSITATYVTNNAWPFDNANNRFYLIIDEQIGGNWVQNGAKNAGYTPNDGINKDALERYGSAMDIDYVHVYSDPKYLAYVPEPEEEPTIPEPATATLSLLALAARRRRK